MSGPPVSNWEIFTVPSLLKFAYYLMLFENLFYPKVILACSRSMRKMYHSWLGLILYLDIMGGWYLTKLSVTCVMTFKLKFEPYWKFLCYLKMTIVRYIDLTCTNVILISKKNLIILFFLKNWSWIFCKEITFLLILGLGWSFIRLWWKREQLWEFWGLSRGGHDRGMLFPAI